MALTVLKQPDGYRCWHEFTPVAAVGIWQSSYQIALGVTQGTWHDTADQYNPAELVHEDAGGTL